MVFLRRGVSKLEISIIGECPSCNEELIIEYGRYYWDPHIYKQIRCSCGYTENSKGLREDYRLDSGVVEKLAG
jgi:hypothetical protein